MNQAACPECNVAYVQTQHKPSVSAGGIFGALIGGIGILVMFANFITGLLMLIAGLIIGSVSRKTKLMLICPQCKKTVELSTTERKEMRTGYKVALGVIFGIMILGFIVGRSDKTESPTKKVQTSNASASIVDALVDSQLDPIYGKVVRDSIDQYNMVKKGGDKIQMCAYAGLVVAAAVQAKDEQTFNTWKAIETQDCKAGM